MTMIVTIVVKGCILAVWVLAQPTHGYLPSLLPLRKSLSKVYYSSPVTTTRRTSTSCLSMVKNKNMNMGDRENEIRRKILQLKKQGRLPSQKKTDEDYDDDEDDENVTADMNLEKLRQQQKRMLNSTPVASEYSDKLKAKLGGKKLSMLGLEVDESSENDVLSKDENDNGNARQAQLGSLPKTNVDDEKEDNTQQYTAPSSTSQTFNILDPSLFESDDNDDDDGDEEMSEDDLVELVAAKLQEKRRQKEESEERQRLERARLANEAKLKEPPVPQTMTTTGIGGSWSKNETATVETYQPKTGSWGAFPRPKDISKAYGGGRRVGVGYTRDDESARLRSAEETRERLKQYREKVGIEVQSEKDYASEIDEALAIAGYAMQRGVYSAAVSALEKVTKWCSTNSKVGGKVFLELAMAYEAEGRTQEAVTVYTTLTTCRMEDIKFNAKRLLYGIEAMQFMREEARSAEFSRKKIRNTFIDTTGLANIAENFDDVYQTAYIDLNSGFYRRLTESVVRSNREARQILLKAIGSGEVERLKVVQALRSFSRNFDTALQDELKKAAPPVESVAVMNGKPIVARPVETVNNEMVLDMDAFVLASPTQMMENLNGEWRLQLLADKRGDGVKYFNTTLSWQKFDSNAMTFQSSGPAGFMTISQAGGIEFDESQRILRRRNVETLGGGVLSSLFFGSSGGGGGGVPQQIICVDSAMLITRLAPDKKRSTDDVKDHFAVWRRVEKGRYSKK